MTIHLSPAELDMHIISIPWTAYKALYEKINAKSALPPSYEFGGSGGLSRTTAEQCWVRISVDTLWTERTRYISYQISWNENG